MKKNKNLFLMLLLILTMCVGLLSACATDTDSPSAPPANQPTNTDDLLGIVAMTVGDIEISVAEYNVYYYNVYNDMLPSYQGSGDPAINEDFHLEVAHATDENILNTISLSDEARKNNMILSKENQAHLDGIRETFEYAAGAEGLTVEEYIALNYGKGVTVEAYEKCMSDALLAMQLRDEIFDSFTYTQSDFDSYYNENKNAIDVIDMCYFKVLAEHQHEDEDEHTDEDSELEKQAALARANAFLAKVTSQATFNAAAAEFTSGEESEYYRSDPNAGMYNYFEFSNVTGHLLDWLSDPARREGDKTAIEAIDGSGYEVLYFIKRQRPEYHSVSARHILFAYKDSEGKMTSTPTEEQKNLSKQNAQKAFDDWKANDPSENSFAALANEFSEDYGSGDGGLYVDMPMGMMVRPFENWCYDDARNVGDTGLIETSFGYHVMYYSAKNDRPRWVNVAHDMLLEADVSDHIANINTQYPMEKHEYGMSLTLQRDAEIHEAVIAQNELDFPEGWGEIAEPDPQ